MSILVNILAAGTFDHSLFHIQIGLSNYYQNNPSEKITFIPKSDDKNKR